MTYFAADAAYYINKRERGFDKCIYMLGADHHGYINRLKAIAACAGDDPEFNIEILIGQLVSLVQGGQPVKLSKRAGSLITLDEIVDAVGVDAARYSLARSSADSPLTLDLDEITRNSNDNPVHYVRYAHARIASLMRNAAELGIGLGSPDDFDPSLLSHERETDLLKALGDFPAVVATAADLREPHRIARYLEDLAGAYHRFYDACRVLPHGRRGAGPGRHGPDHGPAVAGRGVPGRAGQRPGAARGVGTRPHVRNRHARARSRGPARGDRRPRPELAAHAARRQRFARLTMAVHCGADHDHRGADRRRSGRARAGGRVRHAGVRPGRGRLRASGPGSSRRPSPAGTCTTPARPSAPRRSSGPSPRRGCHLDVCTAASSRPRWPPACHPSASASTATTSPLWSWPGPWTPGSAASCVDSFTEIDRLSAIARGRGVRPRVLVRVTVGVEAHTHEFIATAHEDQKFGFSLTSGAAYAAVARMLDEDVLDLVGLHSHIGSQIFDTSGFEVAARRVLALQARIRDSARRRAARAGPGWRLRHRLHLTGRPVAARPIWPSVCARSSKMSARRPAWPSRACRSSRAGPSSGRPSSPSTRWARSRTWTGSGST